MKVLLFGDAPMALNEGGINQTLYNIFCFIKPEDFLGITEVDQKSLKKLGSTEPYTNRYKSYKLNLIDFRSNRYIHFLSPLIKYINFILFKNNKYTKLKQVITEFAPDVVISCSNTAAGILMHDKLLNNKNITCPIVPYFMDDWMYKTKNDRIGKHVNSIIKNMLQGHRNWMMIGKELAELLTERYEAKPENILYVSNPVNLQDAPPYQTYVQNKPFKIAYAGALWPMHFDSFYTFAKAVKKISLQFPVQLLLYTQESQWHWRRNELEPLNVTYGGHLPYKEIHQQLNKADALLVTASFNNENYTHTKASLQTKITDYCKSKRLIISCAPSYAANNQFLKENNCGVCIESNNENIIENELLTIMQNMNDYQKYVSNAWDTLHNFSQETVHKKIKNFLEEVINQA